MKVLAAATLLLAACACGDKRPPEGPAPVAPDAGGADIGDDEAAEAERIAVIEKAMNDLAAVAPQCWAAAAADDYQLEGDVSLLITVDDAGAATTEVRADTSRDPVLAACLRAVVEAYRWPAPMHGQSTLLPFAFTAPSGQNVIDRRLIPEVLDGARVLLDGRNTGNRAVSMFELVVPAGVTMKTTASQRDEVWFFLDAPAKGSVPSGKPLDAAYLPAGAARAPAAPVDAALHVLIVSAPGGDEDATRRAGVLPASPADLKNKKLPKIVAAGVAGGLVVPREGVGTVTILVEPSRVKGDALSASLLDVDAGAAIPPHVHDGSTELLYVLAGSGTMIVDGVELPVTATSVVQIPAGIEHSFTAGEAMQVLQLYTPAGPEQRFKPKKP